MVTFEYPIDIIKLGTSGQVAVYNSATNIFVTSYSPDNVKITTTDDETVKITFDNNDALYLNINLVDNTQIQPALPIAFAGTVFDLAELLATDFFFEVSGGGDAIDVTYDNAVSGLAATDVQAAIDEVDTFLPKDFYKSGTYNMLFKSSGISLVAGTSTNSITYLFIEVFSKITIDKIRIKTNSNAVGQISFALYDKIFNKIVGSDASFDTNLPAGVQILTLAAPVTLAAGTYFWAFSASVVINISIVTEDSQQFFGADTNNDSIGRYFATPFAHVYPLPAAGPTPTSSDNLKFRVMIQNYIV